MKILLVIDRFPIISDAVRKRANELLPGWHITLAGNLEESISLIGKAELAGVVVDLDLPDSKGISTFKKLIAAAPGLPMIVHSAVDKRTGARVCALGAKAFVHKQENCQHLELAIQQHFGQSFAQEPKMFTLSELTPRQRDVIRHIAAGDRNNDIALSLGVSTETVKTHVKNLLSLTECNNRAELAAWATRNNKQSRYDTLGLNN